ncbi:hypothetical protein SLEP1_g38499 [Rubroshorea leprosula]|nr:hypothetical protein SLEP1_g38499 [Rubroshorea leprosula]
MGHPSNYSGEDGARSPRRRGRDPVRRWPELEKQRAMSDPAFLSSKFQSLPDFPTPQHSKKMDPNSVQSTLSNLAFGNVMAAAARDTVDNDWELLAQEKTQASSSNNGEVDLDELMDDPELEKLHADRIAARKKEAEKREALKRQGHGEYKEVQKSEHLGLHLGVRGATVLE